jgi:hypothetical protein
MRATLYAGRSLPPILAFLSLEAALSLLLCRARARDLPDTVSVTIVPLSGVSDLTGLACPPRLGAIHPAHACAPL